jgi:hypothetical protein
MKVGDLCDRTAKTKKVSIGGAWWGMAADDEV